MGNYWHHSKCDGVVVFDLSGGFCTKCHAENLEAEDCYQAQRKPSSTEGRLPALVIIGINGQSQQEST